MKAVYRKEAPGRPVNYNASVENSSVVEKFSCFSAFQRGGGDSPPRYNINIFLMLFGRMVSGLGSSIFNFALGLYVLDLTGSASKFSLTIAVSLLPGFFVNLFGGVFVDRYDKKIIIVVTDLLSGVSVFLYMLLFGFFSRNILLFILYPIILSILQSFFSLALNSAVPNIASDEKVAKANSGSQAIWSMMSVIGPVVGALIYKHCSMYLIFTVYGCLLILAGISEGFLKFDRSGGEKQKILQPDAADMEEPTAACAAETGCAACAEEYTSTSGYFGGIMEAVTYILNQKILVFFFIFSSVMNMVYYPLMAMVMPFINYNVLKVSGLQLSVVQSAGAAGVILGAVLISVWKSANGFLRKFFIFFMLQGVLILMWAFPRIPYFAGSSRWIVTAGFAVLLVMSSMMNIFQTVPMVTYFQVKVPELLRGRVLGIFSTTFCISAPVGLWIFGIAMEGFDWVGVTVFSGVLILVLGVLFCRNAVFRDFIKNL